MTLKQLDALSATKPANNPAPEDVFDDYVVLREVLARYLTAQDLRDRHEFLIDLTELGTDWINRHAAFHDTSAEGKVWSGLVKRLVDEANTETSALGRQLAEEIYEPGGGSLPDTAPAIAKYKLSQAEHKAIRTYIGSAYVYINPATAYDRAWLRSQHSPLDFLQRSETQMLELGGLHGALAISGLRKLPLYDKDVYRGMAFTPAEWAEKSKEYVVGQPFTLKTITSTSTAPGVAVDFITRIAPGKNAARTVGVLLNLHDAGGHDTLALNANEMEVMLLPGTQLWTESVSAPAANQPWYEIVASGNAPA
ncbi:hypothetical protein [Actinoplanes palleronii]|uniref:hypothetical protein n=1 Tax=Actinoplanes palleronii TaxID=113570 RepID=UPI001941546B|nr:hypothetical protein [Actinoplanes palleronii]